MNCSPGELALIVRAGPDAEHLLGHPVNVFDTDNVWTRLTGIPHWSTSKGIYFADRALLPLRGRDDPAGEPVLWPSPAPRRPAYA